MGESFPKDEETVSVSTRACARLLAVLERLGVQPANPLNPLDAASFLLEGLADGVEQINSAVRKHEAGSLKSDHGGPDLQGAGSDRPDDPNQEDEPSEGELEALDEMTHAAHCRVWNENEETDCNCGAGIQDDGHEYDHGGG